MAVQYAPLFALETQFQAKNGRNLTGGFLRVFYAATDDPADTYSDYNLTRNPDRIVLDDNGRALVICDKSKAYRLEVYDADGMLLWTEEPVYCSGTGGGGVSITKVISTDGSISIDESVAGSTTTYDIGLAPNDSDEFLEWIKCSEEDCGSTWYPVYQEGTMETEAGQGIKVHGGQLYHFTNSFTVDPNGSGINYDTFRVAMYCGDNVVDERDFDIDSSLNDPVLCEFSRDVVPTEDTHVYFKLTIPATCKVAGEVQCHRIYSGVNAVPDTCATKQWVSESFQPLSGMSSYVPYSAVGNNTAGQVTGINGSAIAGSLDSAMVSSIASSVASSYTESAFSSISSWTADLSSISSKADQSALTAYQPVSAMSGYATEAYVDAAVGDKLDATASSLFLTGLPDDLATTGDVASAVSGKLDKSASGEFYPMTGNPSGFLTAHQSLAGLATVEYVDSSVSSKLDTSAFASASAGFQPSGNYAYSSSLSAFYPASASGAFQPSGDYAFNSSVSSKLDASASSSFVVNSSMTSWIPYSALDYSGTAISGIGGSSLAGMGGGGGADYTGVYPVNVDNTAREISVDSLPLVTDSSMTAYGSAGSSVIGVNLDIMSGKLDSSAQVVTATATQLYAGTAYLTSVNGAPVSASRAGNAANATLATSAWYDGAGRFISALTDSATVSAIASAYATGKQDTLAFAYNPANQISSINGSALGGMDEAAVSGIASAYAQSAASSKLDKTAQVVTATGTASAISYSWPITTSYLVSSINGSALLPYGYSVLSGNSANWNSVYNTVNSNSASWSVVSPSGTILVTNGNEIEGTNSAVYTASSEGGEGFTSLLTPNTGSIGTYLTLLTTGTVPGTGATLSMPLNVIPWTSMRVILSGRDSNHNYASASGLASANNTIAVIPMGGITGEISASSDHSFELKTDQIGDFEMLTARGDGGMITTGVAELAWKSAVDNVTNTVATNSASWGQGGVSPVTVSSIASSYAQSAASSKLDTTAFNSGDFYSTSNPSGFITGVDLTPYQPVSAMSGYIPTSMSGDFQQVTWMSSYALSSDVSATDNLVGTQSANWGGSALQLSAGPGVKLEKSGNVLVASTDETVLWSSSGYSVGDTMQTYNLSGNPSDFEEIQVYGQRPLGSTDTMGAFEFRFHPAYLTANSVSKICVPFAFVAGDSVTPYIGGYSVIDINTTSWHDGITWQYQPTTTYQGTAYVAHIHKIVGINRTAEA